MGCSDGWIGTTYIGEPTPQPKDQVREMHRMLVESGEGWGEESTAEFLGPHDLAKVGREGSYGIAILAKRRAERTERMIYRPIDEGREGRGAIACKFGRFWAVFTHLQHDPTGYEQEVQAEELLAWIWSGLGCVNVVLGGDFNGVPSFGAARLMERAMGEGKAGRATFPITCIGGIRLDYLFVHGRSIERVGRNRVLHTDTASDHYPMCCSFRC